MTLLFIIFCIWIASALARATKETKRQREIERQRRKIKDPAHGTCVCGSEVYLYNQYMGACECENCGRWYNLFGQEIMPPEMWRGECISEDW